MDDDLNQLALNAELNHWPPHLGVTTEVEKAGYLAQQLREAASRIDDLESQLLEREQCAQCEPCDTHVVEE